MKKGVLTLVAFLIAVTLTLGMPLTAVACDKGGCGSDKNMKNMGMSSMGMGKYNLNLRMNVKMRDMNIKINKLNVNLNTE